MAKFPFARTYMTQGWQRQGFTLTELTIVLGIMGLILGAIWTAANQVQQNSKTEQAAAQVLTIVGNWKSVFAGRRVDLTDADVTYLTANYNFATQDMYGSGTTNCPLGGTATGTCTLLGAWGGSTVSVTPDMTNNGIAVKYSGLMQTQCNNFANSLTNAPGLLKMVFNGTTTYSFPPLGATASPLSKSTVNTACTLLTGNSVLAEFAMN